MFCLSLIYKDQLQAHYLPDSAATRDTLTIPQRSSGLDRDVLMYVRTLDNTCHLTPDESFHWQDGTNREIPLVPGKPVVCTGKGLRVQISLSMMPMESMLLKKYVAPGRGPIRIAQDSNCPLELHDNSNFANHAELLIGAPEGTITSRRAQGVYVNGILLGEGRKQKLRIGSIVRISELIIIYLGSSIAVNQPAQLTNRLTPAAPQVMPDPQTVSNATVSALVQYHRSPRILQPQETTAISIEAPINKQANNAMPLLLTLGPSATMILPMLVSSLVTGRDATSMLIMMGGSAILSMFWAMVNFRYRRSNNFMNEEKRQALYANYIQEIEAKLLALSEQERARLEDQCLSVMHCLELPTSNTHRLWERATTHDDFGTLRLGLGEAVLPSPITVPQERLNMIDDPLRDEPMRLKESYQTIHDAPISINVRNNNLLGVLGRQKHPHLMQSLVMQLAATHSYHDVRIAVLHTPQTASQWEWARWLPHTYASDDRELRMVVSSPNAIQEVLSYMENTLHIRQERTEEGRNVAMPLPHYVIFCTDPSIMEDQPFLQNISSQQMGFTLIIQAADMAYLPRECSTIIQANEQQGAVYGSKGDVTNVSFEWPQLDQLIRFSNALAPIRSKDTAGSAAIPSLVTFLDIYNVRNVDDLDVWRFWNENHAYDGLRSVIGLRAGSKPFVLDISDKSTAHGPHGLVAGTTGAGKSVLLQTYILSLALNYHPDQVQFVLIDYKGGGTNNVFRNMPHVCGLIDNLLTERDIQRALKSVQGEIHRRERTFKRLGISHVDEHIRFYNNDPAETPMGHIIIIVDEFAEMAKEQPDFMKQLISCARVGRSVGIHLILATQKPSNSVNDEIWSNTRFRVCLRVANPGDSNEMLKRPDAAYLRGMGRCYVQVGYDEIFEQVQTSYSGADYAPFALSSLEQPKVLNEAGQVIKLKKKKSGQAPKSQMDAVLERIQEVSAEHGIKQARCLWLDPLPKAIMLDNLPGFAEKAFDGANWPEQTDEEITIPYCMLDDVAEQRHLAHSINLSRDHNHMILGTAGTGKTTLIQTLAMSLAMRYTPDQVQMYIFSLTSKTLAPLAELPHVGDVVFDDDPTEISSLLQLIIREDNRRKELLEEASTDSIAQYNMAARATNGEVPVLPSVVIMIDRMSQLQELVSQDEDLQKNLFRLISEAASRGIYFIITALSLEKSELHFKLHDNFTGVALQLPAREVYKEVLGLKSAVPADACSIDVTAGRGLAVLRDPDDPTSYELCETQSAVFGSTVDVERIAMITEMAKKMSDAWKGQLPEGIMRIPTPFTYKSMQRLPGFNAAKHKNGVIPLGFNKQSATAFMHDFNKHSALLFTGSPSGGKTNALLVAARQFLQQGAEVHFCGLPGSPASSANIPGLVFHDFTDQNAFARFHLEYLNMLTDRVNKRNEHRANNTMSDVAFAASLKPYVILIDNFDKFTELNKTNRIFSDYLAIVTKGKIGVYLLFAIDGADLKKNAFGDKLSDTLCNVCVGVSLGGRVQDTKPWSTNLPLELRKLSFPAGEGMRFDGSDFEHVILPHVE